MNYHEDDRAQRLLDVFPLEKGQVNISYINSTEHIVAFILHEKQTDYWICLKGSLKVGWAIEEDGCEFKYLSDKNPRVLKIPLVCIMVINIRAWFNFSILCNTKIRPIR